MTKTEAQSLIDAGYVAVVSVAYDYADKTRGDVISRHRSSDAAQKAARKDTAGMWRVEYLDEVA